MLKKLLKIVFITLLLAGLSATAYAQYDRPGSTAADFLRIGVSARAAGMGNAYISVVDGADATYYNPAAMPIMEKRNSFMVNHTSWFAGLNHEYVSFTRKSGYGAFGASVTALYTDEMEVRTPQQPQGTDKTFYASNIRANLNYGRQLTNFVSFGGSASLINMRLYDGYVERAYAVDIASLFHIPFRDFKFGMKIANLGSEIEFVRESYPLPTYFSFGTSINAIELPNHIVLVSGSASKPNDGAPVGQAGLEYSFNDLLFLRGGYKFNYDAAQYSGGMGIKTAISGYQFQFDYAYSDFGLLGNAHRFTMMVNF